MASDESSDLFMKFVAIGGKPVPATSGSRMLSSLDSPNELLKGFQSGGFFEIDRFTFKVSVQDDGGDETATAINKTIDRINQQEQQRAAAPGARAGAGAGAGAGARKPIPMAKVKTRDFAKWRDGKPCQYQIDMQPVSFTRMIDATSQIFIQNCIDCTGYERVSIIKRKASGVLATGNVNVAGEVYLRMDFINVLLTDVSWSNDDKVEETCEFVCRSVMVNYKPQLSDGSLGATMSGFYSLTGESRPPLA